MSDKPLSRRQVLGALATTGSAGALVGTGTGALFTDEETFTDNGIRASTSVAGVVDIEVDADPLEKETGFTYEISLPEGVNNNPAYIWVRTLECPEPAQLAEATTIDVSVTGCDSEGALPSEGSALSVLNDLREGALLCKSDDPCLQTDGTRTLEVKVKGVENEYTGPDGPLKFTLELYGQQCRYELDPDPFDDAAVIPTCEEPPKVDGKGISFISFCAKDVDERPNATVTAVTARNDENEPTRATWETNIPVDYVVAKSGPYYTIYDYSGDGGTTSGTVMTGDDPDAYYGKASSFTCPDKNNNGNGNNGNGNNGNNSDNADGGVASCPCALADAKVGDGNGFDGMSTKLEDDKGEIDP
jgi:hypothetical protein